MARGAGARGSGFRLTALESFSGGLNLRSDQFNLAPNESPDLLNVVVDPRGGVRMRDGVDRRNTTALSADVKGMWGFHTGGGTNAVMVNYGTKVAQSTSANFTDLTGITARTDGSRVYGMTMNDVAYGVSYDKPSFRWNGSAAADLGTTFDGTTGNFPQAQYVAFWNNFAWAAHTYEGSTAHKSRVRWSNANEPEKWGEEGSASPDSDYVDIDLGEHGDYITGMAAFGDRLLVFKSNSTYAIFGYDSDSFQVQLQSASVGMIPLSSPAVTPNGVFFWSAEEGVYLYNGQQFVYLFSKLQPAIDDGRITFVNPPQLAWGDNKLFVSLDWTVEGVTTRRTLIYDPTIGEGGAWTMTDIDAGPMMAYRPPNERASVLAGCVANTGAVVDVEDEQNRNSDRYTGSTETHIASHFVTPWLTGNDPITKKRWGKPRFITLAQDTITMPVQVYKNYDKSSQTTTFDVNVTGRTSDSVWDTAKWNDADPDSDYYAAWDAISRDLVADVVRLPTLGTALSISLKVNGPSTNNHWEVNAMAFTYNPRRLR